MRILKGRIHPLFFAKADEGGGGGDESEEHEHAGGKEGVHIGEGARKFAERFRPPVGTPGITDPAVLAPLVNENEPPPQGETPEAKAAREKKASERRKPGDNLTSILEGKRKAEAALAEKEAKVKEYAETIVPKMDATIKELEQKIASGSFSEAKEREFQNRINALEAAKSEKETKLDEELQATKRRLAQISIVDDPVYKDKYVRPLGEAISSMRSIVGENKIVAAALNRAMVAQRSALEADSEEAMRGAEAERDSILDSILEGLGTTASKRMSAAFDKFIEASTNQAVAQADHERTSLELRKESERQFAEGAQEIIKSWETEYKAQASDFDVTLTDEEAKEAEALGVAVDLAKEDEYAMGAIHGKHGQKDVVKLVHRGRTAPVWKAKAMVAEARLKEANATIAKLRGAAPGGGSRSTGANNPPPVNAPITNNNGKSREQWQQERFKPPGAA